MESRNITLKTFVSAILAVFFIELIGHLTGSVMDMNKYLKLSIIRCFEIGFLFWLLKQRFSPFRFNQIKWFELLKQTKLAIVISAIMAIVVLFLKVVDTGLLSLIPHARIPSGISGVQFFIIVCILSPLAEELLFRGFIYNFIRQWGRSLAVIISSLLFSTFHTSQFIFPVVPLLGGILFAVVYELEKHLFSPILIHAVGNYLLFFILFV